MLTFKLLVHRKRDGELWWDTSRSTSWNESVLFLLANVIQLYLIILFVNTFTMKGVKQPSAFSKETVCVCFLRVSISVFILWGKMNCWCSTTLANLVYCLENLFKLYPITFSKEARRFRDTHIVVWWRSNLDFCRATYRSVQSTIVMSHTLASVGGRFLKKRIGLRCSGYDFIVFFLSFVVLGFLYPRPLANFQLRFPSLFWSVYSCLFPVGKKKLPLLVWNWTMNIEPISIKKSASFHL